MLLLALALLWQAAASGQTAGTLSLKDYEPHSMLHADVHKVLRARYPVIDIHNHVNDADSLIGEHQDPAKLVAMLDRLNIEKIVILTGGWGDRLQRVLDEMVKPYPVVSWSSRKWIGPASKRPALAPRWPHKSGTPFAAALVA